jgi:uncharacterized protein (TIGR03000 family)
MSRNWLSLVAVPVIATAALLFAAGAGLAQKGRGGGGGGGSRGGPSSSAHVAPSGGPRSMPSSANFRSGPVNTSNFRGNNFDHHGDFDRHHDFDRRRDVFFFGLGGWGWWNPWWYGGWYNPWYYGDYPYGGYPGYTSFYNGPTTYSDETYNGEPSPADGYTQDNAQRGGPGRQIDDNAAMIAVRVPENAELWFDGAKTAQTGQVRQFQTPALEPGQDYTYEVRARWTDNGRTVDRRRKVNIHAGDRLGINFMAPPGRLPAPAPAPLPAPSPRAP